MTPQETVRAILTQFSTPYSVALSTNETARRKVEAEAVKYLQIKIDEEQRKIVIDGLLEKHLDPSKP